MRQLVGPPGSPPGGAAPPIRVRLLRGGILGLAVAALGALLAAPVLAVSMITNTLDMSPRVFGDDARVSMRSSTTYDWYGLLNPYPSNYVLAINYRHLRNPSIWYRSGVRGGFEYRSSIQQLGNQPGYWLDDGGGWYGLGTVTLRLNADFVSPTTCPTTTVEHWHGQTEWMNSKGWPAILSTTHTSC
jgi:hypothetical protein